MTWNGGAPDRPGRPIRVNTDTGTHYQPALVAGGDGALDVAFYDTAFVEQPATFNKPGAAAHDAIWNVAMAQTLDVQHGQPFTQTTVSSHPVYFGADCTQGAFCTPALGAFGWGTDPVLYDDFGIAAGPDGGARVAWTDTRDSWSSTCGPESTSTLPRNLTGCPQSHVYFACQTGGEGIHGESVTGCGQSREGRSPPIARSGLRLQPAAVRGLPDTTGTIGGGSGAALLSLVLLALAVLRARARDVWPWIRPPGEPARE